MAKWRRGVEWARKETEVRVKATWAWSSYRRRPYRAGYLLWHLVRSVWSSLDQELSTLIKTKKGQKKSVTTTWAFLQPQTPAARPSVRKQLPSSLGYRTVTGAEQHWLKCVQALQWRHRSMIAASSHTLDMQLLRWCTASQFWMFLQRWRRSNSRAHHDEWWWMLPSIMFSNRC